MIASYTTVFIKILHYSNSRGGGAQRKSQLSLFKQPSHLLSSAHNFSFLLALSSSDNFYFQESQYLPNNGSVLSHVNGFLNLSPYILYIVLFCQCSPRGKGRVSGPSEGYSVGAGPIR